MFESEEDKKKKAREQKKFVKAGCPKMFWDSSSKGTFARDKSKAGKKEDPKNRKERRKDSQGRNRHYFTKKYKSSKAKHNAFEILPTFLQKVLVKKSQEIKARRKAEQIKELRSRLSQAEEKGDLAKAERLIEKITRLQGGAMV